VHDRYMQNTTEGETQALLLIYHVVYLTVDYPDLHHATLTSSA